MWVESIFSSRGAASQPQLYAVKGGRNLVGLVVYVQGRSRSTFEAQGKEIKVEKGPVLSWTFYRPEGCRAYPGHCCWVLRQRLDPRSALAPNQPVLVR